MTDRQRQPGFTLIEILIVIAIIALVMLIVLPSVSKLFAAQAMVQGRNLIDAQIKTARSLAIRDRRYTGVHFQRHWDTGEYWSAIVQVSSEVELGRSAGDSMPSVPTNCDWGSSRAMRMVEGTAATRMPGSLGVGLVGAALGNDYSGLSSIDTPNMTAEVAFTTFTVLFDPDGRLATAGGESPSIPFIRGDSGVYWCSPLFDNQNGDVEREIWELPPGADRYVTAVCLFDNTVFETLPMGGTGAPVPGTKEYYLNESARFLVVSPYVGGLIRTAAE